MNEMVKWKFGSKVLATIIHLNIIKIFITAILLLHESCIRSQSYVSTSHAALCMLKYYLDNIQIFCNDHFSKGLQIVFNICSKTYLLLKWARSKLLNYQQRF